MKRVARLRGTEEEALETAAVFPRLRLGACADMMIAIEERPDLEWGRKSRGWDRANDLISTH